jgi:putative transposase
MARFPRVVAVDVPHHITQRGNARQVILGSDADRRVYMSLLRDYVQLYGLSLLGRVSVRILEQEIFFALSQRQS